ncbi:transcription factor, MADS-box [Artemisia annua]|uniref:Transcription factor, MADS-box n=1 Tax=Artemisia annua TaxID=35608 RepID=A0A2U1PD81_ARTAN|nr:transcription factor, MADS-box [Artemisia annua]
MTCAIINGPYKPGYEVWPNDEVVRSVLEKFRSMSVMDRSKHMENKTMYLENRIKKVEERIKKHMMLNRGLEMDNLISDCLVMENQGASEEAETSWYPTDWFEDYNWDRIRGDGASSSKTT